ncbi:DUF1893 domain-containing protein [Marinisporobacter balticus]|uniref:Uncharacterized protein DUF1893 n=1 Tax=Marinisporobacter balticus TaxID=2018667 RepID=A0A4R2KX80_9FIRM|nr:DUF1893 domain-containing protein [Marinisporobacter balticus]TCO77487.1 uncharacterized protein DUF1893 [Marinisporobacter balticus]
MKDIELAKEMLEKSALTLVIVKAEKVIFSSKDKGIKPMYTVIATMKEKLDGASVADRVIGRAAAMLCKYGNIKELHTKIVSEGAVEVLENSNILFKYEEKFPYIKNRDKTDMCPVEKLSQDTDNPALLLKRIQNFLENIKNENK